MPTWILRADRRTDRREQILAEVSDLEKSVRGLDVRALSREEWEAAPDAGKFRDFVPIAEMTHAETKALEHVAEELVDMFGWEVDLRRDDERDD